MACVYSVAYKIHFSVTCLAFVLFCIFELEVLALETLHMDRSLFVDYAHYVILLSSSWGAMATGLVK